jgi:hypothetical protein
MKKFDLERALAGDPVITRDGRPVKIAGYNENADHEFCLAGWIGQIVYGWCKDGAYDSKREHDNDLFMAPTERKEWIVRYDKYKTGACLFGPFTAIESAQHFAETNGGTIHEITITE